MDSTYPQRDVLPFPTPTPSGRDAMGVANWAGRVAAAALAIPTLPLIGLLLVLVRCTSPGDGLYRQRRLGRDGLAYTMYKIRSMRHDAEAATGAVWAARGDRRVTRIGRLLRWSHLDELPQLVNVLRGEMAFIGPRPERPEIADQLARQAPGYRDRLAVLPGITGLAQVNLPPDESLDTVRRKLVFDRYYIDHATLGMDLRILAATALRLLGVRYDRGARWLRLDPESLPGFPGLPEVTHDERQLPRAA